MTNRMRFLAAPFCLVTSALIGIPLGLLLQYAL